MAILEQEKAQNEAKTERKKWKRITRLPVIVGLLSRAMAIAIWLITMVNLAGAQTQQEHVHHMAHTVMPFSMSKTYMFSKMTEQGGVMRVVTCEAGASDQVPLIQQHLQYEATQFQKGDFKAAPRQSCTAQLSPGLKELEAGAANQRSDLRGAPERWGDPLRDLGLASPDGNSSLVRRPVVRTWS